LFLRVFEEHRLVVCEFVIKGCGSGSNASVTLRIKRIIFIFYKAVEANLFSVLKYGNENGTYLCSEGIVQRLERFLVTSVLVVDLVDEEYLRCFSRIIKCKLCSDLHAALTVNNDDRASRNTNSLLNFAREVEVAGGVKDVDLNVVPFYICQCCRHGDTALLFFSIIITNCVSFSSLSETVCRFCEEEHCFREGRLSVATVSHQTYVSDFT